MGKAAGGMSGLLQQFGQSGVVDTMATSMSNASDMVEGVSSMLSGLSSPGGAAALAVDAVAGIATAMFKLRDDMIKADIAKHFGDIELSAEEVEQAAKRLTTTDWTVTIDAYVNAKTQIKTYEDQIRTAKDEIDRIQWKLSVGMELSESDKDSYKNAVKEYTKNCADYITQQGYTASIALEASLSGGTLAHVKDASAGFYTEAYQEMTDLGRQLSEAVNQEIKNNTFNFDSSTIQSLQQRIAELQNKVAVNGMETKAESLNVTFEHINVKDFTKESFD